jgi:hypothetical protein
LRHHAGNDRTELVDVSLTEEERRPTDLLAQSDHVIDVSHHIFLLAEDGYHPGGVIPEPANGLAVGGLECAFIFTGIHTGYVGLTLQIWRRAPKRLDLEWDEVVEITLRSSGGRVHVATLLGEGVPQSLPSVTPQGAGTYRLRVHARRRDNDIDGAAFQPLEHYMIQIWPSTSAADTVHKATDRYGAQRRMPARQ